MNLTERIAYIRGLAEGLKLDENKDEVKVINAMIDLLEDMAYDVAEMEDIVDDVCDQVDELVNNQSPSENIYDGIITAIDFALQNKTAMLHIHNSASRDLFDRYLGRVAQRTVSEFFDTMTDGGKNIVPEDREAFILYYKSLLIGFVVEWLSDGMKYDLTTKIKRVCELFEGTTEIAYKRCRLLEAE